MKKKRNNNRSANLTLGGIALGFLLSYPFRNSGFTGGLIASGCSAGMIGGLADWFAVTALFRRPLGIRPNKVMRTEIIPQNRERIFTALADMVQNELLSQEVLRRKLAEWDFSGVLLRILQEKDMQETVGRMLVNLIGDMVNQPEPQEFRERIWNLWQDNCQNFNLSQTLAELIQFSLKHGDIDHLLKALCRAILEFTDRPEVSTALENMMDAALARYAGNNPTRKMVGKFLPSASVMAEGLRAKGQGLLQDGTVEHWLKDALLQFVLELKTKSSLQERVNLFFSRALEEGSDNPQLRAKLADLLRIGQENRPLLDEGLLAYLNEHWIFYLTQFRDNANLRFKLDQQIKDFLAKQIIIRHTAIGRMVREGLEPLTNDMLVELIEDKAGNDLQMIRINGSVVGALVGMILYVFGVILQ